MTTTWFLIGKVPPNWNILPNLSSEVLPAPLPIPSSPVVPGSDSFYQVPDGWSGQDLTWLKDLDVIHYWTFDEPSDQAFFDYVGGLHGLTDLSRFTGPDFTVAIADSPHGRSRAPTVAVPYAQTDLLPMNVRTDTQSPDTVLTDYAIRMLFFTNTHDASSTGSVLFAIGQPGEGSIVVQVDDDQYVPSVTTEEAFIFDVVDLVPQDAWSDIIVTRSGTTLSFYVNGKFVGSGTETNDLKIYSAYIDILTDWSPGEINPVVAITNCIVDEFAIWGVALTPEDVTDLYNGGAPKRVGNPTNADPALPSIIIPPYLYSDRNSAVVDGVIHFWDFNEESGTTFEDHVSAMDGEVYTVDFTGPDPDVGITLTSAIRGRDPIAYKNPPLSAGDILPMNIDPGGRDPSMIIGDFTTRLVFFYRSGGAVYAPPFPVTLLLVIGDNDSEYSLDTLEVMIYHDTNQLLVNGQSSSVMTTIPLVPNSRQDIVITSSGDSPRTLSLYVNGDPVGSYESSYDFGLYEAPMKIMSEWPGESASQWRLAADSIVDEFAIWDRALNSEEVDNLYNFSDLYSLFDSELAPPSLYTDDVAAIADGVLHHWPFEETSGTDIIDPISGFDMFVRTDDYTGPDPDDSIVNTPFGKGRDPVASGKSLEADVLPMLLDVTGFSPSTTFSEYTLRTVFLYRGPVTTSFSVIYKIGQETGYDENYLHLVIQEGSNEIELYTGTSDIFSTGVFATPGEWFDVVVTRVGTTLSLYVNGALAKSVSHFEAFPLYSGDIVNVFSHYTSSTAFWHFVPDGVIEEMTFWDRGLNLTEVQDLYNGGNHKTLYNL